VSEDGFRTTTEEQWSQQRYQELFPELVDRKPDPPSAGLLATEAVSLASGLSEGLRAFVLGGDGATLFPFERTMRSTDGGDTWTASDVPMTHGQRAYVTGQVVLSDRRLLVLLANWSGDRGGRPSALHHGLWISDGQNWGHFAPWKPRFTPGLEPTERGWSPLQSLGASTSDTGGVIWVLTANKLYVSVDEAQTFGAIPARPGG
jgi:hypothetical protein